MWHGFQPVPNLLHCEMTISLSNLKWNIFHLNHSLWFESRWLWFKMWIEMEKRPKFSRHDTLKHCVSEIKLGWQNRGQKTKLRWEEKRKENNPVVLWKGQSLLMKRLWRQLSPLSAPRVGRTPTFCLNNREIMWKSHRDIWHFFQFPFL